MELRLCHFIRLMDSRTSNPKADWSPRMLVSVDKDPVKIRAAIGNTGYYAVSKNFKHPEVLIQMLNLYCTLYSDQYSKYGITDDGRALWQISPVSVADPDKTLIRS